MKESEYIETIIKNGIEFKVGLDDYGQQYFLEYFNPLTNKIEEWGCGAYNFNYESEAEDISFYILHKRGALVEQEKLQQ